MGSYAPSIMNETEFMTSARYNVIRLINLSGQCRGRAPARHSPRPGSIVNIKIFLSFTVVLRSAERSKIRYERRGRPNDA